MKKLLLLSLIITSCFSSSLFGQQTGSKTVLKGTIINPQRDFFVLKHQGRTDTVKLSSDGKFDLIIEQNTANYFLLEYNRQSLPLYLLPADEVTFITSGINLTDGKITGSSAPYCAHLIQRTKDDRAFSAAYPAYKFASMTGEQYLALRDSVKNARITSLKVNDKSSRFITPFKDSESKIYTYQMGLDLINFKNQMAKSGKRTG